jgi:SAM-dependent methyltransferase
MRAWMRGREGATPERADELDRRAERSLPPLSLNATLRYDVVNRVLDELGHVRSVLEIGAGQGAMAARLTLRYDYVGVEPDSRSCAVAHSRLSAIGRGRMVQGDVFSLPEHERFDLVCAFEVLEHIEDDVGALSSWRRRLQPGGNLLLSVPAGPRLYGRVDRAVGHFRRYDDESLAAAIASAGLRRVRLESYGFPLGYALIAAWTIAARMKSRPDTIAERTAASGRWVQLPESLGWLTATIATPFCWLQRPFSGRWGTGLVALAHDAAERRKDSA